MALTTIALGSTGRRVTRIGLGLAALGRPSYINLGRDEDLGSARSVETMRRHCHDVLDAAYAAGVRYVDAARSYGRAEEFLGEWLQTRHHDRNPVTAGSKWGYTYVADWRPDAPVHEVKSLSVETLTRQIAESRALLGDRLMLYQIHSATIESGVLDDRRVLGELARLASEGLTIGLTVTGPRQADTIRRAFDAEVDGVNPFTAVQATWNILEPSAGPALDEAHARGWGVIVKEVLANGRLTSHGTDAALAVVDEVGSGMGATRDAVAIGAALAQPWIHVILSGAATVDHLRSNLQAIDHPVPADALPRLSRLAEPPARYWMARSQLAWT